MIRLILWPLNKLLDLVLGVPEAFEYRGSTTPEETSDDR